MKKINKYQRIAIIIAFFIGIFTITAINLYNPKVNSIFIEPKPTQEKYDILKEYALEVAKGKYSSETYLGEYIDKANKIKASRNVKGEILQVDIEASEKYSVQANFPIILNDNMNVKDGIIEFSGKIDYKNVTYVENTNLWGKGRLIALEIFVLIMFIIMAYAVTSEIESFIKQSKN